MTGRTPKSYSSLKEQKSFRLSWFYPCTTVKTSICHLQAKGNVAFLTCLSKLDFQCPSSNDTHAFTTSNSFISISGILAANPSIYSSSHPHLLSSCSNNFCFSPYATRKPATPSFIFDTSPNVLQRSDPVLPHALPQFFWIVYNEILSLSFSYYQ